MYTDFTQMPVWQKAMEIGVRVFFLSNELPKKEDYALTAQIRRSAESISANIAEGFGRSSTKDKAQFYRIARGSAFETKSHLIYGNLVGYFNKEDIDEIIRNIHVLLRQINSILKYLKSSAI